MEPNLGQGACQAIEDAVALEIVARAQSPDRMLTEFEALRLKRVAGIVRRAAEGKHGAHGALAAQWAMRNTLRLIPDRISDGLARSIQTLPA
jgi:2-polyprenyl-6-methoxyphenol hydroxylase-like FAD-dependent oxidoreductase